MDVDIALANPIMCVWWGGGTSSVNFDLFWFTHWLKTKQNKKNVPWYEYFHVKHISIELLPPYFHDDQPPAQKLPLPDAAFKIAWKWCPWNSYLLLYVWLHSPAVNSIRPRQNNSDVDIFRVCSHITLINRWVSLLFCSRKPLECERSWPEHLNASSPVWIVSPFVVQGEGARTSKYTPLS